MDETEEVAARHMQLSKTCRRHNVAAPSLASCHQLHRAQAPRQDRLGGSPRVPSSLVWSYEMLPSSVVAGWVVRVAGLVAGWVAYVGRTSS